MTLPIKSSTYDVHLANKYSHALRNWLYISVVQVDGLAATVIHIIEVFLCEISYNDVSLLSMEKMTRFAASYTLIQSLQLQHLVTCSA